MTSCRNCSICEVVVPCIIFSALVEVIGESHSGKLPAGVNGKKITVTGSDMSRRRRTGTTTQNPLIHHEFAVVLTYRTGCGAIAGVGQVSALSPLPYITEHLE